MLTPNQLYYQYTKSPCTNGGTNFVGVPIGTIGAGTPYDLPRLSNFLKQLKYPCYSKTKYSQQEFTPKIPEELVKNKLDIPEEHKGILNSGKYKLALPYRILSKFDVEAFSEIQPDITSGTSMAIRNACDIARSCYIEQHKDKPYEKWEHRMAYEYLYYLGSNIITDCLMILGPDLVKADEALERGTGCGDLDCLPRFSSTIEGSALGAEFQCAKNAETGQVECTPCSACTEEDQELAEEDLCCSSGTCAEKIRFCCGDITGERDGVWRFDTGVAGFIGLGYPIVTSDDFPLKHGGILKRKSYDGYINLLNNSGPNLYSCPLDLLLRYIQKHNNYNYTDHTTYATNQTTTPIDRIRTISLIYSDSSTTMMGWIKDLIYNGYGVVIMTNVGFPNKRDSTGLSFPDRIFYHSYAIIGYDDRKVDYEECVFLLANSWGEWNKGGHPSWGPIPEGSFLVTQSHLECMLDLYRTDKIGCRKKTKPPDLPSGLDWMYDACTEDSSCTPWECTDKQRSLGMAFALSLTDGFPRQVLDYSQFFRTSHNSSTPDVEFVFQPKV
jgi:hypothetical protein